ncbi:MAG: glycosyltransferase family 9 protein [Bacteroidetes bacterium]|nr:glycosyltransferase family 9 protein [Bacteroidota bacterium]
MRKFLIIRFSSIGDIVLTTPIVRCLKKQVPEAEVHFLTKSSFKPILEANPYIDKIYTISEKIIEVLPDLKNEHFEQIIDLHKNFRSRGVIMHLKKPAASFNKVNFKKWLAVNLKINRLPEIHIVDRYFEAVKNLGVKNDFQGLDYFVPEKDEVSKDKLPEGFREGYIGWVIGGKHHTKIYPEEKVIEVILKSNKKFILLGGPEDREKGERIVAAIGERVYNACGRYNLNQSASLVKQANKIVTNDTGLMHIAAAFNKEIISLWGNTIPEFGMYPYLPGNKEKSTILEVKGLSCRPCSKLGFEKCPKRHFKCMNEINFNL